MRKNPGKQCPIGSRVSRSVMESWRLSSSDPQCPESKKKCKGKLTFLVITDTEGNVSSAKRLSGNKELEEAALTALRQWKYKPISIQGARVEVEGEVFVQFR